jgi:hypothetical protein
MKRLPISLLLVIILSALIYSLGAQAQQQDRQLVQTGQAGASKRIALVIGNGAYTNAPPLKNPPNDARDMADALSQLGFEVEHGVDLDQRRMKSMIRQFGQKLKGGGQGLFYFAGHGIQLRGRNYLIPVDAEITSEADVEDQGVDANLVMGLMDEAGNGLNVVILDACRNNPFARSFRSASNGLAQMDAPSGTLIAYATAPGSVASDGNARNGLYTQELLKNMRTPGLGIEEVFKRVRIAVRNSTQGKQTPWESSSLVGDFYFNGLAGTGSAASNTTGKAVGGNSGAVNAKKIVWERVGTGDCGGGDVGNSDGYIPDDNQAREGYTAVCWDGRTYNNKYDRRAFCTYKSIAPDQCRGGGNIGVMYRAVSQ